MADVVILSWRLGVLVAHLYESKLTNDKYNLQKLCAEFE
jgi:hypothetical protein